MLRSLLRAALPALLAGSLAAGCTIETKDGDAAGTAAGTATSGAAPATPAGAPTTGSAGAGAPNATGTTAAAGGEALPADSVVDPTKLPPEQRPRADMRLEVDVAARQVHAFRGDQRIASYPVGVGTAKWPTQKGEWVVSQVVWNPEWIPPTDESWAEDREPKQPGEPDNPLGQAQLVYDLPRTIHGTNQPQSVGKASSHGSIRMRNADIVRLAREVQEAGGAGKDAAWYQRVQANRTTKEIVDLPQVVPITVR